MRAKLLIAAVGIGGAYAAYRASQTKRRLKAASKVRDAGPENMASPPQRWDSRDEALDESFPASDPPATY